jgi:hypothetical protein
MLTPTDFERRVNLSLQGMAPIPRDQPNYDQAGPSMTLRIRRGARNPLAVSRNALEALSEILILQHGRDDQALALDQDSDGRIGLFIDVPSPADQVTTFNGRTVLFLTPRVAQRLSGFEIDRQRIADREQFVLRTAVDMSVGNSPL